MKTDLSEPILPEFVAHAEAIAHQAGVLEEQIINRIHYIMTTIFKLFKQDQACWYFYGAGEGEVGDLWRHYDHDSIDVVVDFCSGPVMVILLKDDSEWGFDDGFPTRWLFENFEQELIDGKKKYEDAQEAKKVAERIKSEAKKEKDKQTKVIAAQAKKKLTKEELAALKQVL